MILITGANGNLGRRLIKTLLAGHAVRAVVRSERAAALLVGLDDGAAHPLDVCIVDYLNKAEMADAARDCTHLVHLVGIIKESGTSSFSDAHEGTSEVVAEIAADAGMRRVIYLSILGAVESSTNACLASKARAESLLTAGGTPALILRVPMVLGEGDYASRALAGRARRGWNFLLRGSSLEQPIYAGDVVDAIVAGIREPATSSVTLDLAGPESLTRAELTRRAAASLGNSTRIVSLPQALGMAMAGLLELISRNPPVSRAMLEVLDHDDAIDPRPAVAALGITLTPLDTALTRCLAG